MRTEDEFGWEGMTGRSCGGSPLGDFKLANFFLDNAALVVTTVAVMKLC